jgi:hypothetical protein
VHGGEAEITSSNCTFSCSKRSRRCFRPGVRSPSATASRRPSRRRLTSASSRRFCSTTASCSRHWRLTARVKALMNSSTRSGCIRCCLRVSRTSASSTWRVRPRRFGQASRRAAARRVAGPAVARPAAVGEFLWRLLWR